MPGATDRERIARLTAQLQAERDRIGKNESEISSLRSRLNLLDERVGELEEELRGTESTPPKVDSPDRVAALETRIDELEAIAKKVRAGDTALREILDRQEKTVEERTGAVAALESRIAELEKTLDARSGDLSRALEKLDAAVAEIAALREHASEQRASRSRPAPAAAPNGEDDLKAIKGIGPKFEKALKALGIVRYAQIAAWSESDLDAYAEKLGTRVARIQKDGWIEAAKKLASET